MAINKVIYGDQTLIDLTSDTATASDVAAGKTFHDKTGALQTGTATGGVPLPATITPGNTPVMLATITNMENGYVYGTTIKEIPGLSLTIKKAGTYRFITSADVYAVNSAYIIYLYKNGVSVAQQSAPSSGNNYNMRLQADIACNVGDIITVRAKARGSTNYTHSDCWLAACINWDNTF